MLAQIENIDIGFILQGDFLSLKVTSNLVQSGGYNYFMLASQDLILVGPMVIPQGIPYGGTQGVSGYHSSPFSLHYG